MRWTQADLDAYEARRKNRAAGLHPDNQKSTQGNALECIVSGEDKGWTRTSKRFAISFRVFSVRPPDWDGVDLKAIQDMVCKAGILPDDNWRILIKGEVQSCKAHSKAEERTEIEIYEL